MSLKGVQYRNPLNRTFQAIAMCVLIKSEMMESSHRREALREALVL